METLFNNSNFYYSHVKWNSFTCGGGIFGFAKNNLEKEESVQEEQNTSAATAPTNSSYWDESVSRVDTTWSGSGTQADPWLITSAAELAGLSYTIYNNTKSSYLTSTYYYYSGCYFKQTVDIDVSAYYWQPIGIYYNRSATSTRRYFSGNYDGDGHTVSGVFTKTGSTNAYSYQGLFGYVYSQSTTTRASISNIQVKDSYIYGYQHVGGIVGYLYNATISNCGGAGIISGSSNVGGILGDMYNSSIDSSFNIGSVAASSQSVGGIAGVSATHSSISNCFNRGGVVGYSNYVGGIVGGSSDYSEIINCYNTGTVTSSGDYVGGITGENYNYSGIANCYNTGSTSGRGSSVGGIAGDNFQNVQVYNCYYGGDCSLTIGLGYGTGTTTRDTNLIANAKTLSWYTNTSNWDVDFKWDFDSVWIINSEYNDGYPTFQWILPREFYFDVNGNLDGYFITPIGGGVDLEGYATFDMYINGSLVASGITDYYTKLVVGTKYEIKNIKLNYDKEYLGAFADNACTVSTSLSGTMPAEEIVVCLKIRTMTWNDYAADSYASGSGTSTDPFIIKTSEQLAKVAVDSRSSKLSGTYYKLAADIDLATHVWEGIGSDDMSFAGVFDGDFYTIKNMYTAIDYYINVSSALFAQVDNLNVQNLIISNANIQAKVNAGGVVGAGWATVSNCIVRDVVIESESYAGGIAGVFSNVIENCMILDSTINSVNGAAFAGWTGILTITNSSARNVNINATNAAVYYQYNEWGKTMIGNYAKVVVNGSEQKVMYGNSAGWGNWTYNPMLNDGYPVQSPLFHIGGMTSSEEVYNYLKNTLGFTVA